MLKRALNEARPADARKADPGMPSSHANSLAFLATFVSLASATTAGGSLPPALAVALVFGVPAAGIFLAWLRVVLGFHTLQQVVAGWLLGGLSALAWHKLGAEVAFPWLEANPGAEWGLYAACSAAVALFAWKNVLRWAEERRQQEQQAAAAATAGA